MEFNNVLELECISKSLLFLFLGFLIGIVSTIIYLAVDVDLSQLDILSIITCVLVAITGWYAFTTHKMLNEQRKSIQISYIRDRLEKLYLPLEDIIKRWSNVEIDDLLLYKYLATKELEKVLEKYIEIHEHSVGFKEEEIENINEEISKIIEGDIERFKQNLAELVD